MSAVEPRRGKRRSREVPDGLQPGAGADPGVPRGLLAAHTKSRSPKRRVTLLTESACRPGDTAPNMARSRPRGSGPSVEALEGVYRENVSAVYGFFSYSVGPDAAEDLTAATFERVVRSWAQFDPTRSSERTWIFTIARNLLTDHWRWRSHRSGPSLDANPELVESLAGSDDPLARSLERDALKG